MNAISLLLLAIYFQASHVTCNQLVCDVLSVNESEPSIVFRNILSHSQPCRKDNCVTRRALNFVNYSSYLSQEDLEIKTKFLWQISSPDHFNQTCGFSLTLETIKGNKVMYFCPSNNFKLDSHKSYYLQCLANVIPAEKYLVTIKYVQQDYSEERLFSIPNCNYKNFKLANTCPNYDVNITKSSNCSNRAIEVSYAILYPTCVECRATIRMCRKRGRRCVDIEGLSSFYKRPMIGKINFTLPSNEPLNDSYIIQLNYRLKHRIIGAIQQYTATKFFHPCWTKPKLVDNNSDFPIYLVFIICTTLAILVGGLLLTYVTRCDFPLFSKWLQKDEEKQEVERVFLVYVDDHRLHREVVLKFAAFLQYRLGYQVLFELFQADEVYRNRVSWMEKCLNEADKVLFVWSPGATKSWEALTSGSYKNDIFTPILRNATNQLDNFGQTNKYFVLHFDYCKDHVVPPVVKSNFQNHYRLMKNFDKFYFKLQGYDGCLLPFSFLSLFSKRKYCHVKDSKHGVILLKAISEMQNYTKENPNWFLENEMNLVDIEAIKASNNNQEQPKNTDNKNSSLILGIYQSGLSYVFDKENTVGIRCPGNCNPLPNNQGVFKENSLCPLRNEVFSFYSSDSFIPETTQIYIN